MKNRTTKKAVTVICAMIMVIALAACGKGESSPVSSELTGNYASTQGLTFMSAYPEFTFKRANFITQNIETFADNTYVLTTTESSYSGHLEFNDNGNYDVVPRGSNIMKYYGSLTSVDEEGLLTLELSKPSAVIMNNSYSAGANPIGYVNTNQWTEEMGIAVGDEGPALSAEEYLATVAFSDISIIVDKAQSSFDYVELTSGEEAAQ